MKLEHQMRDAQKFFTTMCANLFKFEHNSPRFPNDVLLLTQTCICPIHTQLLHTHTVHPYGYGSDVNYMHISATVYNTQTSYSKNQ